MIFKDYAEFAEKVGILDEDQLEALGFKNDNENKICISRCQELMDFIKNLNQNAVRFIKDNPKK